MKLSIEIDSDNDAVRELAHVVDLVHAAADKLEQGHISGVIRDYNGHVVGSFNYQPQEA